ncbi:putative a1 cistron-splicing factor aar2 protein [Neofusicoccum parvum UCRNP2]|uniref:Putative a1 cistron-splicing factor aar2 protein n=1 Tax=Botryosphaeria parva (strain UCR-NP2) TaxID=1287680 RepID=R1GNS9_BOTPV|nr:putative a1 cistron-splicing factor aar2 protein [Neofusicoccum parvum UCRNP2]
MPAAVRPEDVAFNRVSVALARSQSLVASWLPPRPAEDPAAQKTPEQLQQEESALFTPGSDMYASCMPHARPCPSLLTIASLGVGAEPPKDILDGSFKRNQLSSNDRLRQQILGKHAAKGQKSAAASHLPTKKLERPSKPSRVQDDSDDDEDGRAAMFKSKRKTAPAPVRKEVSEDDTGSEGEVKGKAASKQVAPAASPVQEKSRKRPVSFLDEMLEERSKKQKRKQKLQAENKEKATVKAEQDFQASKKEESEASPVLKNGGARKDGQSDSEDSEEESGKATSKSALSKASREDDESKKPAGSTDNVAADSSEKKKKKKKRKKNKGEASDQL